MDCNLVAKMEEELGNSSASMTVFWLIRMRENMWVYKLDCRWENRLVYMLVHKLGRRLENKRVYRLAYKLDCR